MRSVCKDTDILRVALSITLAAVLLAGAAGCSDHRPETLSSEFVLDETGASSPTAAVDEQSGRLYWAWFGNDDEGKPAVFVSSMDPSDRSPSGRVAVHPADEPVNPHPQAPPQIAVAPDGTVYVAWSTRIEVDGRRFPASNLRLARSTDEGRTFEPPIFVNADHVGPPSGHTFHNLAVGPDGIVFVSWLDSRESDAAHSKTGDAAHEAHSEGSSTTVRVARSEDGGNTFGPGVVVARGTCQCCRTGLHVAADGTVYLAWRQIFAGNVRDMALAHSHDGARSFSAPVRIHADNWEIDGCPHSGPSIATDGNGAVHAAWYTAAENRVGLYHAASDDGGSSFSQPRPLVTDVPISSAAVASASSDAWLIWEDAHTGSIHLSRAAADSGDDVIATLPGTAPAIAHAGSRTAIASEREGSIVAAFIR